LRAEIVHARGHSAAELPSALALREDAEKNPHELFKNEGTN
jgi:hypothetical protein